MILQAEKSKVKGLTATLSNEDSLPGVLKLSFLPCSCAVEDDISTLLLKINLFPKVHSQFAANLNMV